MPAVRWILLLACLAVVVMSIVRMPWHATLTRINSTWLLQLDRAPLWSPPPVPARTAFGAAVDDADSAVTIVRSVDIGQLAFDLLVALWVAGAAVSILYLSMRLKRDDLLHVVTSACAGTLVGAAVSLGLWIVLGGWGPPGGIVLPVLGSIGGVVVGVRTRPHRRRTES